jgi:hypothetical protein
MKWLLNLNQIFESIIYKGGVIMRKSLISLPTLLAALFFTAPGWADSPANINTPDVHSSEVKGKITKYRVQTEGLEIGQGANATDAEVMVTMNNNNQEVYVLALHADSPRVNTAIADTLRDAFISNSKVTLYYSKQSQSANKKIHMVQLER